MHQSFSFRRVGLLIAKHAAENKKRYLLSVLAFIGLLIAWFLFVMLTDEHNPMAEGLQQVTYIFSLFIIGTFYASQQFSDLGSKAKATNYLLVPASAFEKLLCGLFYTVVVFLIVFTVAFYIADALMVGIANAIAAPHEQKAPVVNLLRANEFGADTNANLYFLLTFLMLQAAFFLGSVYFSKYSFIKTAIALFATFLVFFCLIYFFHEYLLPDNGDYHKGLTSYRIWGNATGESRLVQLPYWTGVVLQTLFLYLLTPLLWLVTYHRLREKEV